MIGLVRSGVLLGLLKIRKKAVCWGWVGRSGGGLGGGGGGKERYQQGRRYNVK